MKKIMITGASDGIGLSIARGMAKDAQLTLVARSKEKLEKAVAELPGAGHDFLVADLSKKDGAHLAADLLERIHYDILINNAGVGMYGRFEALALDEQVAMMNLNMIGLTKLAHSFLKHAMKGDCLVNIGSTLGTTSFPGLAVYSATKAYVTNFSESLWGENKSKGIYVLGFNPGVTMTQFHATGGGSTESFPKLIAQTPDAVAKELIRALARKSKPKVVSGAINRFMLSFHKLLSRKMVVSMMGGFSPVEVRSTK